MIYQNLWDTAIAIVMVNVICQADWVKGCPESWLNTSSGCVCEGVSGVDQHLNS